MRNMSSTSGSRKYKKPLCPHGRQRYDCVDCGGPGICEHHRRKRHYEECVVTLGTACPHGRVKIYCAVCKPVTVCPCGVVKTRFSSCMAKSNCVHGVRKWMCKPCSPHLVCAHGEFHRECVSCRGKPRRPTAPRVATPMPEAAEPACVELEAPGGDAAWPCDDDEEDPFAGLLD